jgi:GST-like protein
VTEPFKRIDHMVFNVRDLDAAIRFYTDVVGMKVTLHFPERRRAFLSFGERFADIRLFEHAPDGPDADRRWHGFNHVAFMPEGGKPALDVLHQRLHDRGVPVETIETFAGGRHTGIYFRDPDDNRLEFYHEEPSWVMESRGRTARAFSGRDRAEEAVQVELFLWPTSNGLKASIMLELTGLSYRVHPVPLGPGKDRPAGLAEASVTGRIPAIVDNDTGARICESGAILIYLAERMSSPLLPLAGVARAEVLQWLFAVSSTFNPAMTEGRYYLDQNPGKAPFAEARVTGQIARAYRTVEAALARTAHLAGDALSVADVALFPYVARAAFHGVDLADWPATRAWYRRLSADPAFRKGFDPLGTGEEPPEA